MATYLLILNGEKRVADDQVYSDFVLDWEESTNEEREEFPFRWSTGGTKRIVEGDNLILIRVGSPRVIGQARRGIVAYGVASSDNFQDVHWDPEREAAGTPANYVSMAPWVLSEDPIIMIQELEERFPEVKKWAPQSGGPSIPEDVASRVIQLLDERVYGVWVQPTHGELKEIGEETVEPPTLPDDVAKGYKEAITRHRTHQARFRANAFAAASKLYGVVECYLCGFDVPELLEAAHVVPDSAGGAASVDNAILLCPTHHRALDRGFYVIAPKTWPNWDITLADGKVAVGSYIDDESENEQEDKDPQEWR